MASTSIQRNRTTDVVHRVLLQSAPVASPAVDHPDEDVETQRWPHVAYQDAGAEEAIPPNADAGKRSNS